ncbi:type II toxin-antitoxin system VapC family toxin [Phytoactinopolyspora endophytica]|uniref:type II toxin-antitoxin system VapC family toxin n=1 Tax=Phytoactinopolyspora endophytica TaxID=1642495 RepID=UPI00101DCD4B|nr:type II toxin-antitoxin system VapC family toxin [Phytoactinopolyspora endophytica]
MTTVYFDSSAFVKLLVDEEGSDIAASLWDGCDTPTSSRLALVEVYAALAAAARNKRLSKVDLAQVEQDWAEYWAAVRPVELTPMISQHSAELVKTHALRGADGVHLASVLALSELRPVIAVWDKRLHAASVEAGLRVAPAMLDVAAA